jgi:hypothetical protein
LAEAERRARSALTGRRNRAAPNGFHSAFVTLVLAVLGALAAATPSTGRRQREHPESLR